MIDKDKLKSIKIQNKIENIDVVESSFNEIGHVEGLRTLLDNYWDEKTDGPCHKGAECTGVGEKLILCEKCDHWSHFKCVGISSKYCLALLEKYICLECCNRI